MYRAQFAEGHPDRQFFEQLLVQCTGKSLKLRIFTGGTEQSDDPGENQRLRLYKQAQQHPIIQSILETFDADIVAREPSARENWLKQHRQQNEQN